LTAAEGGMIMGTVHGDWGVWYISILFVFVMLNKEI
jgi:hypothetical protein